MNSTIARWFFLLFSMFLSPDAVAIYYKQYTTSNALISNHVYHVQRDSKGFMWFATEKGVSKYDGRSFKNFTTLDGISDHDVFNFYEDKYGRLWLYTYNGNYCYIKNDSVFNAYNDPLLKKLPVISYINAMWETQDTALYIGYETGEVLKLKGNKISWVNRQKNHGRLMTIFEAGKRLLVLSGLNWSLIENGKLIDIKKVPLQVSFYNNDRVIVSDAAGIRLFKGEQMIWKYDDKELNERNVIHLYYDDKGNIFCSTFGGLTIINYHTNKRYKLFQNLKISCVSQDIYGNYWITSIGSGIFCVNKELNRLQYVRDVRKAKVEQEQNGQIFFSENDNIFTFSGNGLNIEKLPVSFKDTYEPRYNDDTLFFYMTDRPDVCIYNKLSKRTDTVKIVCKWLYPYEKNRFLMIGQTEIINIKSAGGNKPLILDSFALGQKITISAFDNDDKALYLLSGRVLYKYEPVKRQISAIDSFPDLLGITNIFCIRDKVILSTNRNELIIYNANNPGRPHKIRTEGVALFGLTCIDEYSYIVNTNSGYYLLRFNRKNIYDPPEKIEYPFKASEFLHLYRRDNNLLCNVNGELYAFDKQLLNRELTRPAFFVDKILVNGTAYASDDITINNVTKCNVNLVVSSLYFANSENNYQYRVVSETQKNQWFRSEGGNINILLPEHGSYKVQVRAITANNIASPVRVLSFRLVPPFYRASWFGGFLVILAAVGVACSVYLYNKRRRKIFQARLNYMQLEHKAINSLLNPHFIFNVINNIQNLVNKFEHEKANSYLAMMSKLIRQNIENLQFSLIPVDKELQLVTNYIHLQNLRFGGRITLRIANNLSGSESAQVPPLLIHTFVENSIVHGFKNDMDAFLVDIDLSMSVDDYLIITVKDNGAGLAAGQANRGHLAEKISMGIDITKKRLERLSKFYNTNYSIEITDRADKGEKGTEVIIIIYSKLKELVG